MRFATWVAVVADVLDPGPQLAAGACVDATR